MKKLIFPCLLLLLLVSCNKNVDPAIPDLVYYVTYVMRQDTSYHNAEVTIPYEYRLDPYTNITFNGRQPDMGMGNMYEWFSKPGAPDAVFTMDTGGKQYVDTFKFDNTCILEIVCPDTISKSKGGVVRIKGYSPAIHPKVRFVVDGGGSFRSQYLNNEYVVLPAGFFSEFSLGEKIISLQNSMIKMLPLIGGYRKGYIKCVVNQSGLGKFYLAE